MSVLILIRSITGGRRPRSTGRGLRLTVRQGSALVAGVPTCWCQALVSDTRPMLDTLYGTSLLGLDETTNDAPDRQSPLVSGRAERMARCCTRASPVRATTRMTTTATSHVACSKMPDSESPLITQETMPTSAISQLRQAGLCATVRSVLPLAMGSGRLRAEICMLLLGSSGAPGILWRESGAPVFSSRLQVEDLLSVSDPPRKLVTVRSAAQIVARDGAASKRSIHNLCA